MLMNPFCVQDNKWSLFERVMLIIPQRCRSQLEMSFTALMCKRLAGGYISRIRIFQFDQKGNAKCKLNFELILLEWRKHSILIWLIFSSSRVSIMQCMGPVTGLLQLKVLLHSYEESMILHAGVFLFKIIARWLHFLLHSVSREQFCGRRPTSQLFIVVDAQIQLSIIVVSFDFTHWTAKRTSLCNFPIHELVCAHQVT